MAARQAHNGPQADLQHTPYDDNLEIAFQVVIDANDDSLPAHQHAAGRGIFRAEDDPTSCRSSHFRWRRL